MNLTILYNLGSLILGLAALTIVAASFSVRSSGRSLLLTAGSSCLCALSLLLQIAEVSHRVQMNDFSAIADTIGAILFASAALFVLTGILNIAAFIKHRRCR